jgi:hypothetical protein
MNTNFILFYFNTIYFKRTVSSLAQCLTNVPTVDASINLYGLYPGQIWNVDDQCRQIYGASSYYLKVIIKLKDHFDDFKV